MKFGAHILFVLALVGCPKAPEVPNSTPSQESPQELELAPAESVPASLRVKFSAKLRVPGRAIPSLPGVLLVDSPRFRMILNGPIGGAVFTAIANEEALVLLDYREGRALMMEEGEHTGLGDFGVQDIGSLTTAMLGRLPEGYASKLSPISQADGEWVFRLQDPGQPGSRTDLGFNAYGHLVWLESYQADGSSLVRLEHEEWQEFTSDIPLEAQRLQEFGPTLLPKRSRLIHQASSVELVLKYSQWIDLMEVGPDAFNTSMSEGVEVLTLQEALEEAAAKTQSED